MVTSAQHIPETIKVGAVDERTAMERQQVRDQAVPVSVLRVTMR